MNFDHRPLEDWEYPDPDDEGADDATDVRACPSCGESVYEDAEHCPHCGQFIVWQNPALSAVSGWPKWLILIGILGVVAVIWALVRGF